MGSDAVRVSLEGLFVGRERFFVAPRLAQRGCFFEQLLDPTVQYNLGMHTHVLLG